MAEVLELSNRYYTAKEIVPEKQDMVVTAVHKSHTTYINLTYDSIRRIMEVEIEKKALFGTKKMHGIYIDLKKTVMPIFLLEEKNSRYESDKAALLNFAQRNRITYQSEVTPVKLVYVYHDPV